MEDLLRVGVFTSTHGIRGEIKVFPTTDDPRRFKKLKTVIFRTERQDLNLELESARVQAPFVLVKFKGIDNINDIERYKGAELYITRDQAVPLQEGEYFIPDLIGLTVKEDNGEVIGKLTDVLQTAANDVYVVDDHGKELLLPAIRDCILGVDLQNGIMTVHVMEGLRDE